METLWSVIIFDEDSCVATVPQTWLFEGSNEETFTYWPPKNKNASSLVKRQEPPNLKWPQFKVKQVLGCYDKYETAIKKTKTAEDTSDLSSSVSDNNKRKRKRNTTIYSDDEQLSERSTSVDTSGNDVSDEEMYPKLPYTSGIKKNKLSIPSKKCTKKKDLDVPRKTDEDKTENVPLTTTVRQATNLDRVPPKFQSQNIIYNPNECNSQNFTERVDKFHSQGGLSCLSTPSTTPRLLSGSTDFQRQVFKKLNIIIERLNQHEETFELIQSLLQTRSSNEQGSIEQSTFDATCFPIETCDDLKKFEHFLEDKVNFLNVAKELSRIGGDSVDNLTRKIMYRIITNDLGQLFSWEGGKGKRKFIDLQISQVILKAVRLNHRTKEACDDEIIKVIKVWLAKAKERATNKLKKLNKSADQ